MWLNRGLVSSNSFKGLSVGAYLLKRFAKPRNILNRVIYCKQNKFRTIILPMECNNEISSRRFFCSGIENNKGLESTEGKNSRSSEKHSELEFDEIEEIDNLSEYLNDVKDDHVELNLDCNEEHMNYLAKIANGDEAVLKKLKTIYSVLLKTTANLGINLEVENYDWMRMLESNSSSLKRFLSFQLRKQIFKTKKRKSMEYPRKTNFETVVNFDINCYHLFHNTLFLRFHRSAAVHQAISKGIVSMYYSPALIFDCSYEKFMRQEDIENLGKQLSHVISSNLKSVFPLHIVICNFRRSLYLGKIIERYVPNFYSNFIPITITEKSYLELYPKKDLCYLSPDGARKISWRPDKNYIVGAFVDKKNLSMKASLAKAKMDDLDHMRFPIEDFVHWKSGSKNLNLHIVSEIMNLMYCYRDWKRAFKALPGRFLSEHPPGSAKKKRNVHQVVSSTYHEVLMNDHLSENK